MQHPSFSTKDDVYKASLIAAKTKTPPPKADLYQSVQTQQTNPWAALKADYYTNAYDYAQQQYQKTGTLVDVDDFVHKAMLATYEKVSASPKTAPKYFNFGSIDYAKKRASIFSDTLKHTDVQKKAVTGDVKVTIINDDYLSRTVEVIGPDGRTMQVERDKLKQKNGEYYLPDQITGGEYHDAIKSGKMDSAITTLVRLANEQQKNVKKVADELPADPLFAPAVNEPAESPTGKAPTVDGFLGRLTQMDSELKEVEKMIDNFAPIAGARANLPVEQVQTDPTQAGWSDVQGRKVYTPQVPQYTPESYDEWSAPSKLGYQVARGATQTLGGELELGVGQSGREPENTGEQIASVVGSILPYIVGSQAMGAMGGLSPVIGKGATKLATALKLPARAAQIIGKGAELYSSGAILGGSLSAVRQATDPEERAIGEKLSEIARDANSFGMFRLVLGGMGAPIKQAAMNKLSSISRPMVETALKQSVARGVMTANLSGIVNTVVSSIAGSAPASATIAIINSTLDYLKNPEEFNKDAAVNDAVATAIFFMGYSMVMDLLGFKFVSAASLTGKPDLTSYYKVLGVKANATDAEIRSAYRNLAKQTHPDFNPNNPAARQQFQMVNEAYNQIMQVRIADALGATTHPAMQKQSPQPQAPAGNLPAPVQPAPAPVAPPVTPPVTPVQTAPVTPAQTVATNVPAVKTYKSLQEIEKSLVAINKTDPAQAWELKQQVVQAQALAKENNGNVDPEIMEPALANQLNRMPNISADYWVPSVKRPTEGVSTPEIPVSGQTPTPAPQSPTEATTLDERGIVEGEKGEATQPAATVDYRGRHRITGEEDAPLHNMNKLYPDDIYGPEAARIYGHYGGNHPLDVKAMNIIKSFRDQPDKLVTVYRAVPQDATDTINEGDWVTITRQYAKEHGESTLSGDYKIIQDKVAAKELFSEANSIHEFGYVPQRPTTTEQPAVASEKAEVTPPTADKSVPAQKEPWEMTREEWMGQVKGRARYKGMPENLDPSKLFHYPHIEGRHLMEVVETRDLGMSDRLVVKVTSPHTPTVKETTIYNSWDADREHPETRYYDSAVMDKDLNIIDKNYRSYDEVFKNEKREDYPLDSKIIYRGMSAPEFEKAIVTGQIQSRGDMNFEAQEGQTLYSVSPQSAANYASGFAPWYMQPSFEQPGYVIQTSRPEIGTTQRPGSEEVAVTGSIPVSKISKVYELRVAVEEPGEHQLETTGIRSEGERFYVREAGHSGLGQQVIVREIPKEEWGKPYHQRQVEQALAEGKPVPPEVLKDYPELQKETVTRITEEPAKTAEKPAVKLATPAQQGRILLLVDDTNMTDENFEKLLAKVNVSSVKELPAATAAKIIKGLEKERVEQVAKSLYSDAVAVAKENPEASIRKVVMDNFKGIAAHKDKTTGKIVESEEYKGLPLNMKLSAAKGGTPLDEIANSDVIRQLGITSESELAEAIREDKPLSHLKVSDFMREAERVIAGQEAATTSPVKGGTETLGHSAPVTAATPAPLTGEQRASINSMLKLINNIVPTRVGKFVKRDRAGIYKWETPKGDPESVARLAKEFGRSIDVASHEMGHHLDKIVGFGDKKFDAELFDIPYVQALMDSKPSWTKAKFRKEGVAEFVRMYITDTANAEKTAPTFYKLFETKLYAEQPMIYDQLQDLQAMWKQLKDNASVESVLDDFMGIVPDRNKFSPHGIRERIEAWKDPISGPTAQFFTRFIDASYPVTKVVEEITGLPADKTNTWVKLRTGASDGRVEALLIDGQYRDTNDYSTQVVEHKGEKSFKRAEADTLAKELYKTRRVVKVLPDENDPNKWQVHASGEFKTEKFKKVGPAMMEIIGKVEGLSPGREGREHLARWTRYMVTKHAIELEEANITSGALKPELGVTLQSLRDFVAEVEKGPYIETYTAQAKALFKLRDHAFQWLVDSGMYSIEERDTILGKWEWKVPFKRVDVTPGVQRRDPNFRPAKSIKGRDQQIKDPLLSIMQEAYIYNKIANTHDSITTFLDEIGDFPIQAGKFLDKVNLPQKSMTISAEEALNKLWEVIDLGDVKMLENDKALQDIVMTIFRPNLQRGKDYLIVRREGKPVAYEVYDKFLLDSLIGTNKEWSTYVGSLARQASNLFRLGHITNTVFPWRNMNRDSMIAAGYSESGFIPYATFLDGAMGFIFDSPKARKVMEGFTKQYDLSEKKTAAKLLASYMEKEDSWTKLWRYHGGTMRSPDLFNHDALEKLMKRMGMATAEKRAWRWWNSNYNPWQWVKGLATLSEMATNLGESMKGMKQGFDPLKASTFGRYVTIDHQMVGSSMRLLKDLVPFINPRIQGHFRLYQQMRDPDRRYKTLLKWLVGITLPSIAHYLLVKDNPHWQEMDRGYRDAWLLLPIGNPSTTDTFLPIPRAHSIVGFTFGAFPARAAEYLYTNDKEAFKEWEKGFWRAINPSLSIWFYQLGYDLKHNMRSYSGIPIENQSDQGKLAKDRYAHYTTETSKLLGKTFGVSPKKIDYARDSSVGALGRVAVAGIDSTMRVLGMGDQTTKPQSTIADMTIIGDYFRRTSSGGANSINDLYALKQKATEIKGSGPRNDKEAQLVNVELPKLNAATSELGKLRKMVIEVREHPTMTAKQKRDAIDYLERAQINVARAYFGKPLMANPMP